MFFIQNKKQDKIQNKVITLALTHEWVNSFKSKYVEIRSQTEYTSFGDNMALYCFFYMYLCYEFEDLVLSSKINQIKKYIDICIFSSTNTKEILKDIDKFVETL